jgi:hypothetical protein
MDRNLNFSFFSLIRSFIVWHQKKLIDRKEERERERGCRHRRPHQVLIQHISELWFVRMFGHRGENTIAMLVLNSPCMNSHHPHIDLLNKKRLSNLSH